MEAVYDEKDFYMNQFFNWVGNAGCLFPFKGNSSKNELILVDIETMKLALDHLLYDKESECFAVKVKESAYEDGLIYDSMEILPQPSEGLFVYKYNDDDEECPPEPSYSTTLEKFKEKYPSSLTLI